MPKKNKREYKGIIALIAVVLILIIHYFFLANLPIHTTLHVFIGLSLFFIIVGGLSSLLENFYSN